MKKILGLAFLPLMAMAFGSLANANQSVAVRADEPTKVVGLKTVYNHTFENLAVGDVSDLELFQDGLCFAEPHAAYSVREDEVYPGYTMKMLDLTIVGDDGGGYAKMLGIGSDGGLKDLVEGRSYEVYMLLDLTQVTPSSTLYVEMSVQDQWTGVSIQNGDLTVLDRAHVHNASYQYNLLSFTFISRAQAHGEVGVRPYFHLTMAAAENSDVVSIGGIAIREAALYSENFSTYSVGQTAPAGNVSNIPNVYNANMTSVRIDEDEYGKYLHITHDNSAGGDPVWSNFYFNQLWNLTSGHTYRLQISFRSFENLQEMYVKYHDTGDACNTFLPNGSIAGWSSPSAYLTNAYWDGDLLSQDILFTSEKDATWWQQVAIQFKIPAGQALDVKISDFALYDVTELGATAIEVSGADSFVLGEEFSAEDLVVNFVRGEERFEAESYSYNAVAFNKDTLGEYDIVVTVNDGAFELSTTYTAVVHNEVDSIVIKNKPDKLTYKYGEALDLTGLAVNKVRENGDEEAIEVTAEMVTGYNPNTLGEQTLTVTFETFTDTFKVTVEDYIASIALKSAPTKVTYDKGGELSLEGAVVTVTMASGATQDVEITAAMISGFDKDKVGEQTITVTYEGKTVTFKVTVNDVQPESTDSEESSKKKCGGSIVASSAILSVLSIAGVALLGVRKKHK